MDCATYPTELSAATGQRQNWLNYVKEQVPLGIRAKKPNGDIIKNLDGLTDQEISELKLCGVLKGQFITDNGTTIAYTRVLKAYQLELWYYVKPPAKYMTGVEGCTVLPYDTAWVAPDD